MNLIEHIADHLDFEGMGTLNTDDAEGNIFWGSMPDAPDTAIAVMSTDSGYGGSTSGARIQIFTRGKVGDVRTPYEMACKITDTLHGFQGYLHGDGPRASIEVISSAQGTGLDTDGRHLYVSNYRITYCDIMEDD